MKKEHKPKCLRGRCDNVSAIDNKCLLLTCSCHEPPKEEPFPYIQGVSKMVDEIHRDVGYHCPSCTCFEPWKPEKNKIYWIVNEMGETECTNWLEGNGDTKRFNFDNCFPDEKSAIEARDKIKQLLTELRKK